MALHVEWMALMFVFLILFFVISSIFHFILSWLKLEHNEYHLEVL